MKKYLAKFTRMSSIRILVLGSQGKINKVEAHAAAAIMERRFPTPQGSK